MCNEMRFTNPQVFEKPYGYKVFEYHNNRYFPVYSQPEKSFIKNKWYHNWDWNLTQWTRKGFSFFPDRIQASIFTKQPFEDWYRVPNKMVLTEIELDQAYLVESNKLDSNDRIMGITRGFRIKKVLWLFTKKDYLGSFFQAHPTAWNDTKYLTITANNQWETINAEYMDAEYIDEEYI